MSCIPNILKLKGSAPILLYGKDLAIEGGGQYRGYDYLIIFVGIGHRCGYVAIPEGHKASLWHDQDKAGIDCHGGVTFFGREHLAKDLLAPHLRVHGARV